MATTKAEKRAAKARERAAKKPKVWLPLPEGDFLNADDDSWKIREEEPMDLPEILLYTLRQCPVKNGEDADRVHDLRILIKEAVETGAEELEILKEDFEWMLSHFKDMSHAVWLAPDSSFLRRYLDASVLKSKPRPEESKAG